MRNPMPSSIPWTSKGCLSLHVSHHPFNYIHSQKASYFLHFKDCTTLLAAPVTPHTLLPHVALFLLKILPLYFKVFFFFLSHLNQHPLPSPPTPQHQPSYNHSTRTPHAHRHTCGVKQHCPLESPRIVRCGLAVQALSGQMWTPHSGRGWSPNTVWSPFERLYYSYFIK